MQKYILLLALMLLGFQMNAQEFNASVSVNAPNLQTADPKIFQTMQNDLYEFITSRKWTDKEYSQEERIDCSINISITEEVTATRFKARVTIQGNRPVFNSGYNTVIFNYIDNIEFQYVEFQQMEFNENAYLNELTSLMAFYAYMILGFDKDSFELYSGTPYFNKAATIVSNAQTAGISPGWQAFDGNNTRYWYNEQALNAKFERCREAFYIYHRRGLDQMYDNPQAARVEIGKAMRLMADLQEEYPNIMLQTQFMSAKSDELISIFGDGSVPPMEKTKLQNMLVRLDPSRSQQYSKISQNAIGSKPGRPGMNAKGRMSPNSDRPTSRPGTTRKGGG